MSFFEGSSCLVFSMIVEKAPTIIENTRLISAVERDRGIQGLTT